MAQHGAHAHSMAHTAWHTCTHTHTHTHMAHTHTRHTHTHIHTQSHTHTASVLRARFCSRESLYIYDYPALTASTYLQLGNPRRSGIEYGVRSRSPRPKAPPFFGLRTILLRSLLVSPHSTQVICADTNTRVVTRGEGTRIEDPSHQDRAGRGHMSLNPISSQSLSGFIYLF